MQNKVILTPYFFDDPSPQLETLAQPGWQVNKQPLPEGSKQQRVIPLYHPIADFVAQTAKAGDRPVSIAGDCCATIPVLAGLERAGLSPTFLWLDSHGDFNTWETTPSGFLGGMPLAMMIGWGEQTLCDAVGLKPYPQDQIILTDGRDLDPGEIENLKRSKLHHVPNLEALLSHPLLDRPLYVHFDMDILNPNEVPAMSYKAEGGPSSAEVKKFFRELVKRNIIAVSVTTWTPRLDHDGRSQAVCMDVLGELVEL